MKNFDFDFNLGMKSCFFRIFDNLDEFPVPRFHPHMYLLQFQIKKKKIYSNL